MGLRFIPLFLFFVFSVWQRCDFLSETEEKEPEELIKLWLDVARNPERSSQYATHYIYYDFISGNMSENFNANVNEFLWKEQLRKSCDKEISIGEHKFLDVWRMQELLSLKRTKFSNMKLINDYDSLREYDVYTTQNGKQLKTFMSFIRIDNKWFHLEKSSYDFADYDFEGLKNKSEEDLAKLNTNGLKIDFTDKIIFYVQDHYRLYFSNESGTFPIHSNELGSILKTSLVPEDTTIIITAHSEMAFTSLVDILDLLRGYGYYYLNLAIDDTLNFFQDSLYKYNMTLKARLERDVNIDIANLNRKNVCTIQPVAFAIDSLNKVYILPKLIDVKPVDYEFIKHYLMQSIEANYDSLNMRKNWAYCLDLVICPESVLPKTW